MKYEITKEQILHVEKIATYAVSKELKEWFPEAFETVFDPRKYYRVVTGGDGALGANDRIGKVIQRPETEPKDYGGEMFDSKKHTGIYIELPSGRVWGLCAGYKLKEATESEVFEALKNELTRLGFVNGVYANPLLDKRDIVKIDLGFKTSFIPSENEFWMGGYCLFKDGVFAEIIPTITKEEAEKLLNKKIV